MGAELAGVFARNVILVGIVLKNDQVGHGPDEPYLPDFFFETQKKHDTVIAGHIDMLAKIPPQVVLLFTGQFALVALAMLGDAVIQSIENRPLLFLYQKQDFQLDSLFPDNSWTQNNSWRRTVLRRKSFSPNARQRRAARQRCIARRSRRLKGGRG
ncbi:hypothetical protein D3C86_1540950 [compost metagenome]